MAEAEEFLTVEQARRELGFTKNMMARAIKPVAEGGAGLLTFTYNPLDRRVKMIRRADVAALKASRPYALRPKASAVAA